MKKTRLLTPKSLLATLVLLVLSGALLVPHVLSIARPLGSKPPAGSPPSLVTANMNATTPVDGLGKDIHPNATFASGAPGMSFYAYVDVINVTLLEGGEVGFTFNYTYLQVNNVTWGSFIPTKNILTFPGSIDNSTGVVSAYGWTLETTPSTVYENGSGHLLEVGFCINPALSPGHYAIPVLMINITTSGASALVLHAFISGSSVDITPTSSQIQNGYFTVSDVVPEFSSVFFAILFVTVTFGAVIVSKVEWSRKRKG